MARESVPPLPLGAVGRAAAIGGAALVVVSAFLEWFGRNYQPREGSDSFNAFDFPAKFLIDSDAAPNEAGLSLGIVVLIVGLVGLAAGILPRFSFVTLGAAVVAIVIVLLFAVQLNQLTDTLNEAVKEARAVREPSPFGPGGYGVRNTAGLGAILAALGGGLGVVGVGLMFFDARRARY
jgi:hypothetical protein